MLSYRCLHGQALLSKDDRFVWASSGSGVYKWLNRFYLEREWLNKKIKKDIFSNYCHKRACANQRYKFGVFDLKVRENFKSRENKLTQASYKSVWQRNTSVSVFLVNAYWTASNSVKSEMVSDELRYLIRTSLIE